MVNKELIDFNTLEIGLGSIRYSNRGILLVTGYLVLDANAPRISCATTNDIKLIFLTLVFVWFSSNRFLWTGHRYFRAAMHSWEDSGTSPETRSRPDLKRSPVKRDPQADLVKDRSSSDPRWGLSSTSCAAFSGCLASGHIGHFWCVYNKLVCLIRVLRNSVKTWSLKWVVILP